METLVFSILLSILCELLYKSTRVASNVSTCGGAGYLLAGWAV